MKFGGEFRQAQVSVTEMPHAREFLQFCRANQFRTFLLSTIHREHFETQGERLGVKPYFRQAYTQAGQPLPGSLSG